MGTFDSKNIKSPSAGAEDLDDDAISKTLQQVVDVINAGNIAGPNGNVGHASAAGATGATGHAGASPAGVTGPKGPVAQVFIPPSTDPLVRGAVWNPGGLVGTHKLMISQG